jgi:ribonuclease HI
VKGKRSGGRRAEGLKNALAHRGRTETTVLLEEPEALDAETVQEDEKSAKAEAERTRPGITMFTDGSRLDDGATGYAVVWQKGQSWVGVKNHMGHNQEAYDAEWAALARAIDEVAKRRMVPEPVTIFTDAQAAIRRMVSEDPGPGQKYAIMARQHIVTLRRARPDITIEIRWCPAHKGVSGNGKPMSGRSSRQHPRTHVVGNDYQGLSPISSGRSRRRSELRPDSGLVAGTPDTSTRCRADSGLIRW